jgi:hypothetical protein
MTTMVPTAVATWAALGEGGSPSGVSLVKCVIKQKYKLTLEHHTTKKSARSNDLEKNQDIESMKDTCN